MSSEKIESYHWHCEKCKKKTMHKIMDWEQSSRFGHSHMCTICGYGKYWEEDHGRMSSGKYINYQPIEDNE